ncbi:MAG: radical SAM protein [Kiloniellales bacterium]|nr:radical SAM protein [Kiloniellales bacterium]
MTQALTLELERSNPGKFQDPERTAKGEQRASVGLTSLATLWFNTGTLCNLACVNCYIESSPKNDRLVYITAEEVSAYLDEIAELGLPTLEIGLTGGEPFMNPAIMEILETSLSRGFQTLVLTNAMRPMMKCADSLEGLLKRYGQALVLRVSIDHYTKAMHEIERGPHSWQPTVDGLTWLARKGFNVRAAGRSMWHESDEELRAGYARLFRELGIGIDAADPEVLVIFPEMDADADVPEITESCWGILGIAPESIMCASSRMVVKRKGDLRPVVMPCTLLPDQDSFIMGNTLAEAQDKVMLNHPHCARFCVLGGGSCSKAT